ncbi:hypothetical protein ACFQJC_06945 [Haloferax namakaokahaiae]|uniref:DUF7992 domain-containing protein n=1 Tax=Haloferax namakaokahaiae TaxID=1748331 RepID=A0ABD5ZDL4_9EURY
MGLDVPTPNPPASYREARDDEYVTDRSRRAEIQAYLTGVENAWTEAFTQWSIDTSLSLDEYQLVLRVGLLDEFDFYWDDERQRIEYTAPKIPDEWEQLDEFDSLDSWATVSAINDELDELGDTVAGVLTDYYVSWDSEDGVVDMFGSQFNARDDVLTDVQDAYEEGRD